MIGEQERYRTAYQQSPSILFVKGSAGTILDVNEFGAEYLGYTPEELIGSPVGGLVHSEDRPQYLAHLEAMGLGSVLTGISPPRVICCAPSGRLGLHSHVRVTTLGLPLPQRERDRQWLSQSRRAVLGRRSPSEGEVGKALDPPAEVRSPRSPRSR